VHPAIKQKGSNLASSEIDSKPVEFRSLNYKEHPVIKQKGSNLASFRNRFKTCKIQELKLQGASNYQARRINPASLKHIQPL